MSRAEGELIAYYDGSRCDRYGAADELFLQAIHGTRNVAVLDTMTHEGPTCRFHFKPANSPTVATAVLPDYASAFEHLQKMVVLNDAHDTVVLDTLDSAETAAAFREADLSPFVRARITFLHIECVDLLDRMKLVARLVDLWGGRHEAGSVILKRHGRRTRIGEEDGPAYVDWIDAHTMACDSEEDNHDWDWGVRAFCLLDLLARCIEDIAGDDADADHHEPSYVRRTRP